MVIIWVNMEIKTMVVRVPLIISVPWLAEAHGQTTASLTELVNIGPTATFLAVIGRAPGVDGKDLWVLFSDPKKSLKDYAFHSYPACGTPQVCNHTRTACNNVARTQFRAMGYSVRNDKHRYPQWLL